MDVMEITGNVTQVKKITGTIKTPTQIIGVVSRGSGTPTPITGGYHFVFVSPVIFETGDINAANVYSDVDLSPVQQPGGV